MEKQPQPPPLKAVLMQHLILGVKLALIAILVWTLLYGVFLLYLGVAFAVSNTTIINFPTTQTALFK